MAGARGVGSAAAVSIALHLMVVAALWRSPAPVGGGLPPVLDVVLAPAPAAGPVRPEARARAVSPAAPALPGARTVAAPRADAPDAEDGGQVAAAASPSLRADDPRPAARPPEPSSERLVDDPFEAWSRLVWAAIDRRRPRAEAGATAARVAFTIDRDGRLAALRLAASSGAPGFDRAAMRAVRAAAPFPAPPAAIDAARLRFEIVIRSAAG